MPNKLPDGTTVEIHDLVPSTMDIARNHVIAHGGHHWIMAKSQSNARGRRGKSWLSQEGGFAATCVFDPNCAPLEAAQRSFVMAVALQSVLKDLAPTEHIRQKWPNDVLLNGGKVAGILLESASSGAKVSHLAIGVGVNLGQGPGPIAGSRFPPVGLADVTGNVVSPEIFLPRIASAFHEVESRLMADGFSAIRDIWLASAARLGEEIHADTGANVITGRFETVDVDGNLVLLTPDGRKVIPAGDVYF